MKISEMIIRLEELKSEYGDLPIMKSSCHSIPEWKIPDMTIYTYTERMDECFAWNNAEDVNVGEKFVWL